MSISKPYSHRRVPSSFIDDTTDLNLIQLSPHKEQRSPYTMTGSQESRTNFIGDSIISAEKPRAFAITQTGEKHILDWDVNAIGEASPRYSARTMEKISEISEKSLSDFSLPEKEKKTKSSGKLSKKPKPSKCHVNKKHRLVFTPRNLEDKSSTELLTHSTLPADNKPLEPIKTLCKITNSQTQTDNLVFGSGSSYKPSQYSSAHEKQSVTQLSSRYNFNEPVVPHPLRSQKFYRTVDLPEYEPLKIYTKTNSSTRKYCELRAVASAITLITLISWLYLIIFDVQCPYFDSICHYIRSLFSGKQKPKTKIEILVQFVQDFFS